MTFRALVLLSVLSLGVRAFKPKSIVDEARNVVYIDWKLSCDWGNCVGSPNPLTEDIKRAIDVGFNVVNIAFWLWVDPTTGLPCNGCQWDAAFVWTQLSDAERQDVMDYAHARDSVVMISCGGATDLLISATNPTTPELYCDSVALYANQYQLDGVDFDIELRPGDSASWAQGWPQEWLAECNNRARSILGPDKLISHAPQGPYLGPWAQYGYVTVDGLSDVDWYNIQYYNQGGYYLTYQNIFTSGLDNGVASQTSVREIAANGIDENKLVIGKPLTPNEASPNSYLAPQTLGNFIVEAEAELNWRAGAMTWQYNAPQYETANETGIWGAAIAQALGLKKDL